MKAFKCSLIFRSFLALFFLTFLQAIAMAQDNGGSSTTTTTSTFKVTTNSNNDWYMQPWVWVVGAAVFILLLVALLRGSGNK